MELAREDGGSALNALRYHIKSLKSLCESIEAFTASCTIESYKPPIIDRSTTYADKSVGGLAKFGSLCSKELDHHLYLLQSKLPLDSFSSNAPFLTAVWQEVMTSPKPVIEIYPQVPIPNRRPFKFDVISANGNRWHKINTITKQRLLSEIMETESSDDDSSTGVQADQWSCISIVRQCVVMREASVANPVWADGCPRLILRLTRLCEAEQDHRIQSIYSHLRTLGVDLQFGDPVESGTQIIAQSRVYLDSAPIPSMNLNLDLSMLVALISDISHAPLPSSLPEAEARFQPVRRIWKRKTSRIDGHILEDRAAQQEELGPEEHSRALIAQLQQEMQSALIPDLIDTIASACDDRGLSPLAVRFWTTREAMERCLEIARKIAGPRELARAYCLFQNSIGSSDKETFWSGSRHRVFDGPLKDLHIRIIEDEPDRAKGKSPAHSFATRLESACRMVLENEGIVQRNGALPRNSRGKRPTKGQNAGNSPKKPSLHTVRSMLAGATHGMTTITANRMSVKQMVRIMGLRGLTTDDDFAAFLVAEPKTLAEQKRTDAKAYPSVASIWTLEPRSLAESMVTKSNPDGDQH